VTEDLAPAALSALESGAPQHHKGWSFSKSLCCPILAANQSADVTASQAAVLAISLEATLDAGLDAKLMAPRAAKWSVSMLADRSAVALCCAIRLRDRSSRGKLLWEYAEVLGSGAGCGRLRSEVKHGKSSSQK